MKGIVHDVRIFWSILVLVILTCKGQPQGRPYFQNQQHPQDLQNVVPRQANDNRHIPPNVQQQYRPQPAQGVQQNGQLQGVLLNGQAQPQKNYYYVNRNQAAAAQPANVFQQNGQVYKRVGDFQTKPVNNLAAQNVDNFNQPKPHIDTNFGSPIRVPRNIDLGEGQRNEIHDNVNPGGLVVDNTRNFAKENAVNKPLKFNSQAAHQGSMNQNVLDLQGTGTKQNNDTKSVFVINKNTLANSDNNVNLNEQPKELTNNRNEGIPVNDRIREIQSRLDRQGPLLSNNEQVQEKNVIESDVRYPLKGNIDSGNIGNIGANQESFDLGNKQPIGANDNNNNDNDNSNLPVDSKLNEAYKDLAHDAKGLPANIKVIDGEVEKDKGLNEGGVLSDNYEEAEDDEADDEEDEGAAARRSDTEPEIKEVFPNEIPRVINANNGQANQNQYNGFGGQQQQQFGNNFQGNNNAGQQNNFLNGQQLNNGQQFNNVPQINAGQQQNNNQENKEGSLKVVWDWSDFAVNFEQYIAPEQKIRRAPHATTGEPWPLPQYYIAKQDLVYRIDKTVFHFKLSKVKCDIIEKAIDRYKSYVLEDTVEEMYDNFQHAQSTLFEDPTLKYETTTYTEAPLQAFLSVKIRKPCGKLPGEKMDESYDLFIKRTGMFLWANEVWGALRGLETFSQLVFKGPDSELYIKDTVINDYPRFSHRGVLIDSSRHFIFKETIFDALDIASLLNKNVFGSNKKTSCEQQTDP